MSRPEFPHFANRALIKCGNGWMNQLRDESNKMQTTIETKLQRGDLVNVFQKPLTDERLEGKARLWQHHAEEDDLEIGERWTVMFAPGDFADRWVHVRHRINS